MTFQSEGGRSYQWDLTLEEWLALVPEMGFLLGQPRMGEVGVPRREITVEPETQPERVPEPIREPVPEKVPVPV